MKTLHISIIIGIMLASCFILPNATAQVCFGGQACGGKPSSSFMDGKNVAVSLKFYSNSTASNNIHYLWLRFFDKNTNQTIPHVSFFLNATKDDEIMMHELFYTNTGSMTLQFSSGSDVEKWIVNGNAEPVLGGMMSDNDVLPIETSAFTPGTYHIHLVILALVFANGLVDQNNPPTFDSWWSVDDKGNISKYDNSTTISFGSTTPSVKIKNESPLKQFKSGIAAKDVKCNEGLVHITKMEDGSPACVAPDTATKLVERGWTKMIFETGIAINSYTPISNGTENQTVKIVEIKMVPPYTPGGPVIQLTIQNIGTAPITNLNAILETNYNYTFNFQSITPSTPLISGNSVSNTTMLIGSGFQTESMYSLIISGMKDNMPFEYLEKVHIQG